MTKLFRTAAIVAAFMTVSLSQALGQNNDPINQSSDNLMGGTSLTVYATLPVPTWIENTIEDVTMTITWCDAFGSDSPVTHHGNKAGNTFEFWFWNSINATHVVYQGYGLNASGNIVYCTWGTHYFINGNVLVLNPSSWSLCTDIGPGTPSNPK